MKKSTVDGAWITAVIEEIAATSAENTLNLSTGEKAFDAPLVGFSNGADPLFEHYVAHIGDFYLTPLDIFKKAFPREPTVAPGDLPLSVGCSLLHPVPAKNRPRQSSGRASGGYWFDITANCSTNRCADPWSPGYPKRGYRRWRPCSNLSGASPTRDRMHRARIGRNGMRLMPQGSAPSDCVTG